MADKKSEGTVKKAAKVAAPPKPKKDIVEGDAKTEKVKKGCSRNYDLGNGIMRFSRTKMFHKRAAWKFQWKKAQRKPKVKVPQMKLVKPTGDKKDEKPKLVILKKRKKYFPTMKPIRKHPSRQLFSRHKRYLKKSLGPGTVCILLAGKHKGKRVVVLKQLESGLLLITGPLKFNGCPLRRMNQIYVIGTRTKIDMSEVKIPTHINDEYFKKNKKRKAEGKKEGDIFKIKKRRYKVSADRKADQQTVDDMVNAALRKHPDKKHMFRYLSCMFGLKNKQFPHQMQF